ncbi:MAG: hypothetical protein ACR2QO_06120 [Acidimicrobiales bacterium]
MTDANDAPATGEAGDSTTTTTVEPAADDDAPIALPFGFRRCSMLLSTGVVDGPLSDDPEVAQAQQWRADHGLRSDEDWVRQVPTMDRTSDMADAFAAPLTDDEVIELTTRGSDIDHEALAAYTTEHQATLGGYWLDHTAGGPTISFIENVEQRRAEVAERIPGVRVVAANLTEAELIELQTTLIAQLADLGLPISSAVLVQAGGGVVSIGVPVLNEPTLEVVAQVADPQVVCLEGLEPDEFTGPQPKPGELTAGLDGPVVRHRQPVAIGGEDAALGGTLVLDGDCLYLGSPNGVGDRYPVVWPSQTTWDAETQSVVLPSGHAVAIGESVSGGGGFHGLESVLATSGAEAEALVSNCLDNTFDEIAIINNFPDAIRKN